MTASIDKQRCGQPTQGYLLDMDGVIYRGGKPIPGARDFLNYLQKETIPFLLLTNHSCLTPSQVEARLARMDIAVPASRIYTSALCTAEWLEGEETRSVFAMGEDGVMHALRERNIDPDSSTPSHVVVGLDRNFDYQRITAAYRFIVAGVPFIATNPDTTYPVEDGDAPENGLLLGALQHLTGVEPFIIGKPSVPIFHMAAKRLGIASEKLTMIGDRVDIDIAGARLAGMKSVLVTTGHTKRGEIPQSGPQPDAIVDNLMELAHP